MFEDSITMMKGAVHYLKFYRTIHQLPARTFAEAETMRKRRRRKKPRLTIFVRRTREV